MRRRSIAVAGLALMLGGVPRRTLAEDAPPAVPPKGEKPTEPAGMASPAPSPPVAPAPTPAGKPGTPEQAADAALAAVKAKDDAALKALAGRDEPDPWLVADELLRRGEHDAAAAFAKAAPRPDTESLPAFVAARRATVPLERVRELWAAMNAAIASGDAQRVVAGTETVAPDVDAFFRVRLLHVRCNALFSLSRWRECATLYRTAGDVAVELGWLRRASLLYERASESSFRASDGATALQALDALLRLSERRGDKRGAAGALGQIGFVQGMLGDPTAAGPAFDRALAAYEALGFAPGMVFVLSRAATVYAKVGDRKKEIAARERMQPILEAQADRVGAAENLNLLGIAYSSLGDPARALSQFEDSLTRVEALGDRSGMAARLINIGSAYRDLGDRARAISSLERGRALAEEVGPREWLRNALVGLGQLYMDVGDLPKALAACQQLLAHQERWGDKAGAALTVKVIGDVYRLRGDLAKAVSTYQQALARLGEGDSEGAAAIHTSLGASYLGLGDYAHALSEHERAFASSEARADKAGAAGALVNIGIVYRELGDDANALDYYQRGLALAEEAGQETWKLHALANIAGIHRDRGEPARALAEYERVLAETEKQGDRYGTTNVLNNLGLTYVALGDASKALPYHQRALETAEAAGDNANVVLTLQFIARAHRKLGDDDRALAYLDRSVRAARSRRLSASLFFALGDVAMLHMDRKESAPALRAASDALREMEGLLGGLSDELGASARSAYAGLFAAGALAAMAEQDPAALLTFLESGRAGALLDDLDKREALRWKADALSPELRRQDLAAEASERAAREAYEQAARGDDRSAQVEAAKALDKAADGVRAVEARIQRELKLQAQFFYPRAKAIEEIRAALEPDQALVLYGLCWDDALALVLRADGERIVPLGKAADVVAACEALDASDRDADAKPALEELRRRLVEPLALEEGVKQVLVSPEGPLSYLPFSALFAQTVAMTPSGTTHVLLREEQGERGRGILALGDPDYAGASAGATAIYHRGHPLTRLPATREEATTVGTRTLLGADASEETLRDVLPTSTRWRAIHFACHGLVNVDKPMLSSLALTRSGDGDGFLTALEVLRLKIPADLVVLSACETATGKIVNGEGIVGLTRAFMFAGSPRVICSLWKVDDEATKALMTKFYELWNPKDGKPGLPTAEALRKAQEFVRSQEKWKHPYYWAAWVLWGLPS